MENLTLNLESLRHPNNWPDTYQLPSFDVPAMIRKTISTPTWLHMGAGNIFRIFIAALQQDLLELGLTDTGIIAYEAYDEDIIPASLAPYDNLTLAVGLNNDGNVSKRIIASIADAFHLDLPRLMQTMAKPSLQIVSFTITEKGYIVSDADISPSPDKAKTAMEQTAAGLYARFKADAPPLALVTLDNFAENGTVVAHAMEVIATSWVKNGHAPAGFIKYVKAQSYPWTMIDKITPMPSQEVAKLLEAEGFTQTQITETKKHTTIAPFVNAEIPQYLVIEDSFPNGRPPLEKAGPQSGVFFTDRETVKKTDRMKVCACLNPLHTILGVCGTLLDYPTIEACMQDKRLVKLINLSAKEAMPVVKSPGIIDPQAFLDEIITQRFPNPFIPDTPARINMDASQKIPIRFGVTLQSRLAAKMDMAGLTAIPQFIALWLRFRMGIDDMGVKMDLSPDPKLPESVKPIGDMSLGERADLRPILSDTRLFGVDLYTIGLGEKIEKIFARLAEKPDTVCKFLTENYGDKE